MGTKNIINIKNIRGNKTHPTEKPVELNKIFILNSSNEKDVVLDCFMGSGSTGVACLNTNRNFIGIELDKDFFEIAKKRIEDTERS
jgi:site-specific DNA-methyltransferase (adenine-specific)